MLLVRNTSLYHGGKPDGVPSKQRTQVKKTVVPRLNMNQKIEDTKPTDVPNPTLFPPPNSESRRQIEANSQDAMPRPSS